MDLKIRFQYILINFINSISTSVDQVLILLQLMFKWVSIRPSFDYNRKEVQRALKGLFEAALFDAFNSNPPPVSDNFQAPDFLILRCVAGEGGRTSLGFLEFTTWPPIGKVSEIQPEHRRQASKSSRFGPCTVNLIIPHLTTRKSFSVDGTCLKDYTKLSFLANPKEQGLSRTRARCSRQDA